MYHRRGKKRRGACQTGREPRGTWGVVYVKTFLASAFVIDFTTSRSASSCDCLVVFALLSSSTVKKTLCYLAKRLGGGMA